MEVWQQPAYSDQGTGITILGVLMAGLAVVFLAMGALILAMDIPQTTAAAGIYFVIALPMAGLGIGLFQKRRWARALTEAGGWLTAGSCAMSALGLAVSMAASRDAGALIMLLAVLGLVAFGVVVPAAIALYLGGRNSRLTCEAYDPVARWTDALSVITLVLVVQMSVSGLGLLAALAQPVQPWFGKFLPAGAARAALAVTGLAWIVFSVCLAARRDAAWFGALALSIVLLVSNALNAARIPVDEILRRSGLTPEQIRMAGSFGSNWHVMVLVPSAALVALIVAERFCRKPFAPTPAPGSAPAP